MSDCVICREPLLNKEANGDDVPNLKSLRCGHLLHCDCWENWVNIGKTGECPICRRSHTRMTEDSYFFLSMVIIDVIRCALVLYMAYRYYMSNTLDTLYHYIFVDILLLMRYVLYFSLHPKFTHDYLSTWQEGIYERFHGYLFMYVLLTHLLQVRIWLPNYDFVVSLLTTAVVLYHTTHYMKIRIND